MEQNNKDTMQIDNSKIFDLLFKLSDQVSGLDSTVKSVEDKLDQFQENMEKQIEKTNQRVNDVTDLAKTNKEQIHELQEKNSSKRELIQWLWVPMLASIIPSLISHIHIR